MNAFQNPLIRIIASIAVGLLLIYIRMPLCLRFF